MDEPERSLFLSAGPKRAGEQRRTKRSRVCCWLPSFTSDQSARLKPFLIVVHGGVSNLLSSSLLSSRRMFLVSTMQHATQFKVEQLLSKAESCLHKQKLLAAERRVLADVVYGVDVRSALFSVAYQKSKIDAAARKAQELLLHGRAPAGVPQGCPRDPPSGNKHNTTLASPCILPARI
jgi:hypothetical protein